MDNIKSNMNFKNKKFVVGIILLFLSILSIIWLKSFADDSVPTAPSNLSYGTVTSSSVSLSWTDNSSNEDKFNIERKLTSDSTFAFLTQITTSNTTSFIDTSVTAGSIYDYRVQACLSGTGCSDYSTLTSVAVPTTTTTPPTAPTSPSNFTYTTPAASMVRLSWTDNSTNEDKFTIMRKLSTANWSDTGSIVSFILSPNTTSYNDTSLTVSVPYDYRVVACLTGVGCSDYATLSGVTSLISLAPPTASTPNAPSNLTYTTPAVSVVRLSWTDNSTNEDKWNIDRKLSSTSTWTSLTQITTANTTFYYDTSVTAGSSYDYRVQACLSGTGCSSYVNLTGILVPTTTGGGTSCTGLTLTLVNNKTSYTIGESVNYTWNCSPGTASNVSMWLYKPDSTSVVYGSGSGSSTQSMGFSTSNLVPGSYTLKACFSPTCASGTVMASQTFTLTTTSGGTTIIPNAPTNLSLSGSVLAGYVPLRWNDNSTNEDSFKIERKLSTSATFSYISQVGTSITNYIDTTAVAGVTYDYQVQACLSSVGCSSYVTLAGVTVTTTASNPNTTGGNTSGSGSCTNLNLTFANNKTSYTIGESVNYTWICSPGGTASNVSMWLSKPDGTSTLYNSGSGSGTQSMGFSTSNLVPGSYTLKACFSPTCASGTVMASQTFNVVTTTANPSSSSTPNAPSNLTHTTPAVSVVRLSWTDNSTNEDKWNIDRKLSSTSTWTSLTQITTANTTFYYDTSVTAGYTYDYRVQACLSGTGCSSYTTLNSVLSPVKSTLPTFTEPAATTPASVPQVNPTTTPTQAPATQVASDTTPKTEVRETTATTSTENTNNIVAQNTEISKTDISAIINTISGPVIESSTTGNQPEIVSHDITDLVYKDTNKDGISDYDSKYIYNIDPVKPSTTSTYEGKSINAGDKILLGFDPTKSELVKVEKEQPVESQAAVVSSYKVNEVTLENNKAIVFKGQALPNSFVTVYIYSTPIMVTIKTDSKGEWQYSVDKELENGNHTVYIATVNNTGNIVAKSSPFSFTKTAEAVTLQDLPIAQSSLSPLSSHGLMEGNNLYIIIISLITVIGITLTLIGLFSRKSNSDNA